MFYNMSGKAKGGEKNKKKFVIDKVYYYISLVDIDLFFLFSLKD